LANINHYRPQLKNVDNYKKVLSATESSQAHGEKLATKPPATAKKLIKDIRKEIVGITPTHWIKINLKDLTGKELDKTVHAAACHAVSHLMVHGDVTLCNRICLTLKGVRQEAMINWFVTYASCSYDSKKKILVYLRGGINQVEKCKEKNFLEFKRKLYEKGSTILPDGEN